MKRPMLRAVYYFGFIGYSQQDNFCDAPKYQKIGADGCHGRSGDGGSVYGGQDSGDGVSNICNWGRWCMMTVVVAVVNALSVIMAITSSECSSGGDNVGGGGGGSDGVKIGGSADFGCCGGDNVGCGIRMVIVRAATLVMVLVFLEMVAVVMVVMGVVVMIEYDGCCGHYGGGCNGTCDGCNGNDHGCSNGDDCCDDNM